MNDRPSAQNAADRQRLLDEFGAFLERAADSLHPGSDAFSADDREQATVAVDLATLLAEMAVLKNEVRLQSRQFKNTLEELRQFGKDLRENCERLQRELDRSREQSATIGQETETHFLLAMLDLRDRLQSGLDAAGRASSSLLTRLIPGPTRFAASLAEGQRLTVQRLDDFLASHRVHALSAIGEMVDPRRMRVVGVESGDESGATSAAPADGTVLREVQRGYLRNGELLRVAEVIVSKKAKSK